MKRIFFMTLLVLLSSRAGYSFCGFYVAKADTKLFNKASQVAIVHADDKTVITMANDFEGDPKEFAIVVPVPTPIQKNQIHVAEKALLDHLDAYSSPRLVEYFDPDPCMVYAMEDRVMMAPTAAQAGGVRNERAKSLGVTIEAQYTVGEYDILILSAKESGGLQTWLSENGYRIPPGATQILGSYIRQNMRFFVARVNLGEKKKLGYSYLRPLQIAFTSPKFMLPIRLGTLNANGDQELFIYMLSQKGRVETTNYRTVKLPSGDEIPPYVKNEFGPFYKAMFSQQVKNERKSAVFLEYAWDMNWCDPCAADPLSSQELRQLGVFWTEATDAPPSPYGGAVNVFLSRLHVRYDAAHFPEDLAFQETSDRENFQARYVLRHPWTGKTDCAAAKQYRNSLAERQSQEAITLAKLTGWDLRDVRRKANLPTSGKPVESDKKSWWESIWN